jgi:hypothetical protein
VSIVGALVPMVISYRACIEVMVTICIISNMENVANLPTIRTSTAAVTCKISGFPLTTRDGADVMMVII